MHQLKNIRYFFNRPKSLRIHLGAHKTATTHLQDTLKLCSQPLLRENVWYISVDAFRYKLRLLDQDAIFSAKKNWIEKRYTLTSKLFNIPTIADRSILLSEENILGRVIDVLYLRSYPSPNFGFINYARKFTDVHLFLSIRSFSQIYPAAYATGLKFYPEEAIRLKTELLEALERGEKPSWTSLVERIESQTPGCTLRCWTFEHYKAHQQDTFSKLTGTQINNIPSVDNPSLTATPSVTAIKQVEAMIAAKEHKKVQKWFKVCGDIYRQYPATNKQSKYTFISKGIQEGLDEQYNEDIEKLSLGGYFE